MNKLIRSQQDSQKVMEQAMTAADRTVRAMRKLLPAWLDAKESDDQAEIKSFFGSDVVETAREIRTRALKIRDELLRIADAYDDIIKDTITATASSEKALGDKLTEKAAIEKEINEANAKREQLESLVADLKEEVAKFDKMAKDYETRASTAEQRAFVMSIVRVGAQMISQAVPAIAMAAGGPAPMLASSALSALNGPAPAKASGEPSEGARSADTVQTKTRISEQKAELKKADDKATTLKADIKSLEAEKAKLTQGGDGGGGAAGSQAIQAAEYDKRIRARTEELKAQEEARARIDEAVNALQASLAAADKGLGKMSDEQQQQAASLREMQMRMLDKVETYEKERRSQSAELVKINALLKGMKTDDTIITLAVKSLNLSISALKRTKEIVVEIAFFFKSFADFMDAIALEAADEAEDMENAAGTTKRIGKNQFRSLVESVDRFFITQTAEWLAVKTVADKFNMSFADGWSKLNKLSGTYITGDQLEAYLDTASVKLAAIAAEREAAADQKIASLAAYRTQMRESA